jgi:hypothetical protein
MRHRPGEFDIRYSVSFSFNLGFVWGGVGSVRQVSLPLSATMSSLNPVSIPLYHVMHPTIQFQLHSGGRSHLTTRLCRTLGQWWHMRMYASRTPLLPYPLVTTSSSFVLSSPVLFLSPYARHSKTSTLLGFASRAKTNPMPFTPSLLLGDTPEDLVTAQARAIWVADQIWGESGGCQHPPLTQPDRAFSAFSRPSRCLP